MHGPHSGLSEKMPELTPELSTKREHLLSLLQGYSSCLIAMSAGVDSTVVAKAAALALGDKALAVTGTSSSLAGGELDEAISLAMQIGIRHEIISTNEFNDPNYVSNPANR